MTARDEALSRPLPERVPWETLGPEFYEAWGHPGGRWQPEHLSILGPTGSGKSWFEKTILQERARLRGSHIVIIATKPADATLKSLGWPIITAWPPKKGWGRKKQNTDQVIFWAKANGLGKDARERQRQQVEGLLSDLWKPDSNIIVAFDELAYLEQELQLRTMIQTYYREARALGITIVGSTQRPANVSRYMHSESTWSVFFAPKDEEDAERMAQVAGNKLFYRRVLATLNRASHEFLMVNNLTGKAAISSIPDKRGGKDTRPTREPVAKPPPAV